MQIPSSSNKVFRFGPFEVEIVSRELRKRGRRIKLQDQPFEVLKTLLECAGEVVTREELHQKLWSADTFVDFNHGLQNAISRLRESLGDSAEKPLYIETLPRLGYRFIAPLKEDKRTALSGDSQNQFNASLAGAEQPVGDMKAALDVLAPESTGTMRLGGRILTAHKLPIAAASVLMLVVLAGWLAGRKQAVGNESRPIRSVAVLPLENLSGDSQQEYFSEGVTDQIIANLSRIRALRVISRTSIKRYKRGRQALPEIAKELNVDAIVEGSIIQSNGRVRISTRLVRAQPEENIWTSSFERDSKDVLALQAELAYKIAQEIHVTLNPSEKSRIIAVPATDSDLHQLYLKGRFFVNIGTEKMLDRAVETFTRVIERDPNYAPGYVGLAEAWSGLSSFYLPPREVMPKAKAAALKAVQLDEELDTAHAQLGYISFSYDWDWVTAEREFKRAIELNPSSAEGHDGYANLAAAVGRIDDAVREIRLALAIDPLSFRVQLDAIFAFLDARRYDEALVQARRALEIEPRSAFLLATLGLVHGQKGEIARAVDDFEAAVRIERTPTMLGFLAHGYALAGNKVAAEKVLRELTQVASRRYVCPFEVGTAYSTLGRMDEAFSWMNKGVADRADCMTWLRTEPWLDPLRADPRYPQLLRAVGLPGPERLAEPN